MPERPPPQDQELLFHPERRGFVTGKFPFRLDIAAEYQDWILAGVCIFLLFLWTLPCFCGRIHSGVSKAFISWIYARLHVFYWGLVYLTLASIMFTITILPDWTMDDFVATAQAAQFWILDRLVKIITSATILFGLYLAYHFRERVLVAAGMEHITLFRWNFDPVRAWTAKMRPIEIFIWKVDGLRSSNGKVMKANDIFVECHLGQNEPMRTRVHNNAGSDCIIKESLQLNINEGDSAQLMTILLKDQSMLATVELARLSLSTAEICGIEDATGKRRVNFSYCQEHFVPLGLNPQGQVWIAVAPVDDAEDARLFDDGQLCC